MLDKIIPIKLNYFFELIRFSRPIGFLLLMWPCWLALALLPLDSQNIIKWYLFFFIGAFLMRSAGCIINDYVDINIDRKVKRTKDRPLTSQKISKIEALIFLFILLFLSLIVLMQFNYNTIFIALLSFPLIILYPYMKRYTNWPQIFLGIIFSWGVIIVSIQFMGDLNWNYILLYIACIFWTLAYDTIYAYQDIEDDIKNNIKSSAVFLGDKGKQYVKIFYLVFFSIIGYLSFKTNNNFYSLIVIIIIIFVMNHLLNKWDPSSKNSSNYYFRFNNVIGLSCFLFLLIL
jgi:4-hydroxybenzoate polyprenyltransferase